MDSEAGSASSPRYRLVVDDQDGGTRDVHLDRDRFVVGRSQDCDVVLSDPSASRHHVVLEVRPEGVWFRDLGGTNVTLLNGRPAREGLFDLEDSLTVGLTRLRLELSRSQAAVRVVDKTAVIMRRYLKSAADAVPPDGGLDGRSGAVARVLEALAGAPYSAARPEVLAAHVLELALDATHHRAGLLGRFDRSGTLQTLASLHREGSGVDVAEQLLADARRRPEPFLAEGTDADPRARQLVVPIGPGPGGLLLLQDPLPDGPSGPVVLALATAIGRVAWARLEETDAYDGQRQRIALLEQQRPVAHRAVLAVPRLAPALRVLEATAGLARPVRLVGPEGTELERLARYLHAVSPRADGPFLPLYAGLLPPARVAEELFGSTSPVRRGPPACLLRADGGTLYVDRPERLPSELQRRLAAALDAGRLSDGEGDGRGFDVRVVVGLRPPDQDDGEPLEPELDAVLDGEVIEVPALRGHTADILALVDGELAEMGPDPEGRSRRLTQAARNQLAAYRWPGNTRELTHVIWNAAARAGSDAIDLRHLPVEVREVSGAEELPSLEEVERRHIEVVLAATGHKRRHAARILGIAPSTLYEKLARYRIS